MASRDVEVFSLSFLDLISCAMAALLVLFAVSGRPKAASRAGGKTGAIVVNIPASATRARVSIAHGSSVRVFEIGGASAGFVHAVDTNVVTYVPPSGGFEGPGDIRVSVQLLDIDWMESNADPDANFKVRVTPLLPGRSTMIWTRSIAAAESFRAECIIH